MAELFLIIRISLDIIHKCTQVVVESSSYSCQILMALEFSRHMLENPRIFHFMELLSMGAEFFRA